MQDSFYGNWLLDGAHSFYTRYDQGPLQPMYLQENNFNKFHKRIFSGYMKATVLSASCEITGLHRHQPWQGTFS